ncbi:GGDEF domain-containing protein [Clostridium sp. 19966]|uniref:diguanylate cyclase n=1 Tax=Clostridium sp. 19966 TaxID=2768166 RepID=UPI0028E02C25|nr:diguanylate cyclase [Clostridium sp. 19966]MDT8719714.1 GGDEF domain-containing protein [Clostridium sp. 19966]
MDLIAKITGQISVFNKLYDYMRVVDPLNKTIVFDTYNEHENDSCFDLWKKNSFCKNCISMRAYINNDTFIKIEYDKDKIILIIAIPVCIDGNTFIVELIKDISKNGSVLNNETYVISELINSMNEKTVKDKLTDLYNINYIEERLPIDFNYSKINNLPLSLIMTEIDYLDDIKKRYGDIIEERALVMVSGLIKKSIRNNNDWVGRYSSRKFIVILNNVEVSDAYIIADRLRSQIKQKKLVYKDDIINFTSSFAVYRISDYDTGFSELLSKVDSNLSKAMSSGSDRIIINEKVDCNIDIEENNNKNIKLARLDKQIGELREVLNEICCTLDENDSKGKQLIISQWLDELIVEYMKEVEKL